MMYRYVIVKSGETINSPSSISGTFNGSQFNLIESVLHHMPNFTQVSLFGEWNNDITLHLTPVLTLLHKERGNESTYLIDMVQRLWVVYVWKES